MLTRADVIYSILAKSSDNRMRSEEIRQELARIEGVNEASFPQATVNATVRGDNKTRVSKGQPKRFRHYGDGNEERGYISLADGSHGCQHTHVNSPTGPVRSSSTLNYPTASSTKSAVRPAKQTGNHHTASTQPKKTKSKRNSKPGILTKIILGVARKLFKL